MKIIFFIFICFIILNIKNTRNFKILDSTTNHKKILIITLETRNLDYLDLHNESVQKYCDMHGYTYLFQTDYKNDLELPIYWKKIQIVLDHLPYYDYVVWLDSDSMITKYSTPLESVIDLNKSILISTDFHNIFNSLVTFIRKTYCTGVFIIKNNDVGKQFLNDCIHTYINNPKCKTTTYNLNGTWAGECYEQGVVNQLLKTSYKQHVYELPFYVVMNTYFYTTDAIILHKYGKKDVYDKFNDIKSGKEFHLFYL